MKRNFKHNPSHKFWLYGIHAVEAALENPRREKHRLVVTDNVLKKLSPTIFKSGICYEVQPVKFFQSILEDGVVHQGVALEVNALQQLTIEEILNSSLQQEWIILDGITDIQNVGAILRTALAFAASGVITTLRNAPKESGALAKASSGALEKIPLIRITNLVSAIKKLKKEGYWVIGLDHNGVQSLEESLMSLSGNKVVFALGSEGKGLRRLTAEACDFLVHIPTKPAMESINVSNVTAICLYANHIESKK